MPNESILIVDDNQINLKLVSFVLSSKGFQVRGAADAAEALATLETFHPRVILMDLQLPGLNGMDLTRQLKSDPETREIIIIAVTAYAMKGDADKAREAGCEGYITKPIDTRTLVRTIEGHLAGI